MLPVIGTVPFNVKITVFAQMIVVLALGVVSACAEIVDYP